MVQIERKYSGYQDIQRSTLIEFFEAKRTRQRKRVIEEDNIRWVKIGEGLIEAINGVIERILFKFKNFIELIGEELKSYKYALLILYQL